MPFRLSLVLILTLPFASCLKPGGGSDSSSGPLGDLTCAQGVNCPTGDMSPGTPGPGGNGEGYVAAFRDFGPTAVTPINYSNGSIGGTIAGSALQPNGTELTAMLLTAPPGDFNSDTFSTFVPTEANELRSKGLCTTTPPGLGMNIIAGEKEFTNGKKGFFHRVTPAGGSVGAPIQTKAAIRAIRYAPAPVGQQPTFVYGVSVQCTQPTNCGLGFYKINAMSGMLDSTYGSGGAQTYIITMATSADYVQPKALTVSNQGEVAVSGSVKSPISGLMVPFVAKATMSGLPNTLFGNGNAFVTLSTQEGSADSVDFIPLTNQVGVGVTFTNSKVGVYRLAMQGAIEYSTVYELPGKRFWVSSGNSSKSISQASVVRLAMNYQPQNVASRSPFRFFEMFMPIAMAADIRNLFYIEIPNIGSPSPSSPLFEMPVVHSNQISLAAMAEYQGTDRIADLTAVPTLNEDQLDNDAELRLVNAVPN